MPNESQIDLVFLERPDLTLYLIHLTKSHSGLSAQKNLSKILKTGTLKGSDTKSGFIKGPNPAVCLMDVPFAALKFILNKENTDSGNPRYEPYGIVLSKKYAYEHGCRPVLYLSNLELKEMKIEEEYLWRVVRLERGNDNNISWLHEREWRCKGSLDIPTNPYAVLVKTSDECQKLAMKISEAPDEFKCKPRSILPLSVICQGLPYMK